ncbi:MAG TPA: DUF3854 domain-containing protein [Kofleriaceae bacterium]
MSSSSDVEARDAPYDPDGRAASARDDDWARIALDERRAYIAFDSDVMRKPSVHSALERLASYLSSRGSIVQFVYLPDHGPKLGIDDFLAADRHTLADAYQYVEDTLRPPPIAPSQYRPVALPTTFLQRDLIGGRHSSRPRRLDSTTNCGRASRRRGGRSRCRQR